MHHRGCHANHSAQSGLLIDKSINEPLAALNLAVLCAHSHTRNTLCPAPETKENCCFRTQVWFSNRRAKWRRHQRMNSNHSKYSSGLLPPNRSGSTNSCPKDSDAESEIIDMASDSESCDSLESFPSKPTSDRESGETNDRQHHSEQGHREEEPSRLESPRGGHQPPVVASPVKQMAQQFGPDLSGGPFGSLSLPSLAMSMFMPGSNGTPSSVPFLDGTDQLGQHAHHHYLNALHQQQQQYLFNSSLKLGIADHHHHHAASAFRKVK